MLSLLLNSTSNFVPSSHMVMREYVVYVLTCSEDGHPLLITINIGDGDTQRLLLKFCLMKNSLHRINIFPEG